MLTVGRSPLAVRRVNLSVVSVHVSATTASVTAVATAARGERTSRNASSAPPAARATSTKTVSIVSAGHFGYGLRTQQSPACASRSGSGRARTASP